MARNSKTKGERDRKPSLEAFRALAILAETGNITETARQLGVSQPVISKKLRIFKDKDACGAILLQPDGRGELTEAGLSALPAIRELINRYDRLMSFLEGKEISPQVVRVASGSFAAEHYLPSAITAFSSECEECQIETRICRGRERILGTARGAFDIAIVTHDRSQIRNLLRDERLNEESLIIEKLGRHPMCVTASTKSVAGTELASFSDSQTVPLNKLTSWELVGPDRQSGLRRQLEHRLRGKSLYFVTEGGGWSAAKEFARKGLGVAIVPSATITSADKSTLVSRRLSSEFDVTDLMLSRNDDSSHYIKEVKAAIKATVKRSLEET